MRNTGRRALGTLMLGTFLATMPVAAGFHAGGFGLAVSQAFAKNGDDDKGGDDRGGDDRGGGKGGSGSGKSGGDDRGGSGKSGSGKSGGSDDRSSGRSKSSGSGKSGSSDDNRGRGRGGDDGAGDDNRGRGRGGDDRGGDDNRGRGRGGDDDGGRRGLVGGAPATLPGSGGGGLSVVKFERSATGVEVTYSNGVKEEIENGRFEQKNAAGRTVIERPATQGDLARLDANARNSGVATVRSVPAGSGPARIEVSGSAIEVSYATGWREEIEGGRYELKDPNNNTVVERPATTADVRRLRTLAGR